MIAALHRLLDAIAGQKRPLSEADEAIERLRQANRMATRARQRTTGATGNPIADRVRGYGPPRKEQP